MPSLYKHSSRPRPSFATRGFHTNTSQTSSSNWPRITNAISVTHLLDSSHSDVPNQPKRTHRSNQSSQPPDESIYKTKPSSHLPGIYIFPILGDDQKVLIPTPRTTPCVTKVACQERGLVNTSRIARKQRVRRIRIRDVSGNGESGCRTEGEIYCGWLVT
ncbi:hypothetical protein BU24DRAFT_176028 [Aaosphaeria arxii CBS 175.79]|uniref:Uncharacterized protein n=1 Tax=Aaosphaeria arxii CBS 175.79 TaxID=1450172 RepID=A0A6A5XRQ4_9PLEO|nr:uncharacterized protein BU24DRAFT_176028 [Aaosphaeria arxii CBS 175.79]KAF2015370.1 hypothetical protein BU24DRAFT_176028 [Aaosphaeria arxii CBS 175.79]